MKTFKTLLLAAAVVVLSATCAFAYGPGENGMGCPGVRSLKNDMSANLESVAASAGLGAPTNMSNDPVLGFPHQVAYTFYTSANVALPAISSAGAEYMFCAEGFPAQNIVSYSEKGRSVVVDFPIIGIDIAIAAVAAAVTAVAVTAGALGIGIALRGVLLIDFSGNFVEFFLKVFLFGFDVLDIRAGEAGAESFDLALESGFVIGGELVTDTCTLELKMGTSVFVPAGTGAYTIKGNCDVIITTLP